MLAGWLQVNHGPALAVLPEGEAALKGAVDTQGFERGIRAVNNQSCGETAR